LTSTIAFAKDCNGTDEAICGRVIFGWLLQIRCY
jgi:hypothetical protein